MRLGGCWSHWWFCRMCGHIFHSKWGACGTRGPQFDMQISCVWGKSFSDDSPGGCGCWTWFIVANAWQRVSSLKAMLINISTSKPLLRATGRISAVRSVCIGESSVCVCVCMCGFDCHDALITDSALSCGPVRKIFLFWLKLISNSVKLCTQDLIGALKLQYNRWRVDLWTNRAATGYTAPEPGGFTMKCTHASISIQRAT